MEDLENLVIVPDCLAVRDCLLELSLLSVLSLAFLTGLADAKEAVSLVRSGKSSVCFSWFRFMIRFTGLGSFI